MDTNSIELTIVLERISLMDTFFHVNRPTSNRLQGNLAIDMPHWDYDDGSKSGRPRLNALINVSFTLSDGPAPEQITPETSGKIALTFGCLLDVAVGSPALGEAIPAGKHVVIEGGDLDAHRSKRMERSLMREALESAYAFASTRLIETSSLSPMGTVTMSLPDYEVLIDQIEEKSAN